MNLDEFLKRNGISVQDFMNQAGLENWECYEEYNDGIGSFAVYGDYASEVVDVKDIVGLKEHLLDGKSIVDNFSKMFDPIGDTYHSRANGMLAYSSGTVMNELERSFRDEPVKLYKIQDKYFVSFNGAHRVELLKMHYLMESLNGKDATGKYQIPAMVETLDYVKTYVNFVGSLLWDKKFRVWEALDEKYKKTGKAEVIYDGKHEVMGDYDLVMFLMTRISELKSLDEDYYLDAIEQMWRKYQRDNLFKKFVSDCIPQYEELMNIEDYNEFENSMRSMLLGGNQYGNN